MKKNILIVLAGLVIIIGVIVAKDDKNHLVEGKKETPVFDTAGIKPGG